MQEFKAKAKTTQKMTRDGVVETNRATGEQTRTSNRETDDFSGDTAENVTGKAFDRAATEWQRHKAKKRRRKAKKEAKQAQEESLLETKNKEDEETAIKIQIVRHIVGMKQEEAAVREKVKENKEMKQRLLEIKASREDKRLESLSDEDLEKMIADL